MRVLSYLVVGVLVASSSLVASDMAEKLFVEKCAVCHSLQKKEFSEMVAPPARGVMFHMNNAFSSKEKMKEHIVDFVMNPSEDKAICKSIKRFGLMPSQKGAISNNELDIVADWMIVNLSMSEAEHRANQKKHQKSK